MIFIKIASINISGQGALPLSFRKGLVTSIKNVGNLSFVKLVINYSLKTLERRAALGISTLV